MAPSKNRDFDIDIDSDFFSEYGYEEGPVLGSEAFGIVSLATSKCDPDDVMALKTFHLSGLDSESESIKVARQRMFLCEVSLMKDMEHKHIMPIIASIKTPDYLAIAMPYCRRGTLNDSIKCLSQEQQFKFINQLCQGVDYLHNNKIIHGDIKPRNILIKDDDNIWISDFGLAKSYADLHH